MKIEKQVLASIRPEWCRLILNGNKTVEVRKTKPQLQTPFKCYIYCTLSGNKEFFADTLGGDIAKWNKEKWGLRKGMVICEFVCDRITRFKVFEDDTVQFWNFAELEKSCLTYEQIAEYIGRNKFGYAWHISELKIYDKPKELKEFFALCDMGCELCEYWTYQRVNADEFDMDCGSRVFGCKEIKRPPQSWCYVEEVEGGVL